MDRDEHATSLIVQPIPAKDLPEFYRLQERNRERIQMLLQAFKVIEAAPTLSTGYDLASASYGGGRGSSAHTMRRMYLDWRNSGRCWRSLIDGALEYQPAAAMPKEFIDYVQDKCDDNIRSIQSALKKEVRAKWTAGQSIPGYGTWKEYFARKHPGRTLPRACPGFPPGWSPRNLRKKLDPSKFRRKAVTQGRGAAAALRPLVLSTRKGLWVHSHLMWDDVWHDNFVNTFAEKQAGRPLELFAHDYFSARKVRYGVRVRTSDDAGTMQGLTSKMMRMIVAATYYLDGYSPRGTVNVAEHGTAAFTEHMERTLYDCSGGLITVERSGMQGDAAHLGQFNGRRIGNFRFKASLESSNNLTHNLLADLPGQTGPSVERRPEELHGLLQYNSRLLAAYQQLPADRAALLKFPLLEVGQFLQVLGDVYQFMESDPDHNLEGWENNITQELLIFGEWRTLEDLLTLAPDQQAVLTAMLHSGTVQTRPRKMSRMDVWRRGSADLVRIHGGTVCELLGEDFATERKVKAHQFCFEDKEVGPGEHRFEAVIMDAEGRMTELKDGQGYEAFINPFAPDQLFVRDAKGRYLGTALRTMRHTRNDTEAMHRAMGHAKKVEGALLAPLEQRQKRSAKKKLTMHRHNADVLKDHAQAQADFTRRATDALNASLHSDTSDAAADTPARPVKAKDLF